MVMVSASLSAVGQELVDDRVWVAVLVLCDYRQVGQQAVGLEQALVLPA